MQIYAKNIILISILKIQKKKKVYYKKINTIVGLLNDYRNELNFNSDP